ncbi:MAG: hypothetical protein V6Z86_06870 [Hyphomicrobiales bacterium]
MDDYHFWQDVFDTYQSLSDWMKFAGLVVPLVFLLGLICAYHALPHCWQTGGWNN